MARHSFESPSKTARSTCVARSTRSLCEPKRSGLSFVTTSVTLTPRSTAWRRSHSFNRRRDLPSILTTYALTVLIYIAVLSPTFVSALSWVGSNAVQQRTLASDAHASNAVSMGAAVVESPRRRQAFVGHASHTYEHRDTLPHSMFSRIQRSTRSTMASSATTTTSTPTPSPTAPPWIMPRPFDTDLGKNFTTSSCPTFFDAFLANTTITNCHAVSMLLENSNSFFHSLTSAVSISRTLDAACAVSEPACTTIMTQLASHLLHDDACGQDFRLGNPLVQSAYVSMVAYEPLYRATCLISPDTANYCFVDAALNGSTNLGDYDVYLVPLGTPLTATDHPTCNKCLQATMTIYSQWAPKNGQPLADTYLPSARQVDLKCGVEFANTNISVGSAHATTSGAGAARKRPAIHFFASVILMGAMMMGLGLGMGLE